MFLEEIYNYAHNLVTKKMVVIRNIVYFCLHEMKLCFLFIFDRRDSFIFVCLFKMESKEVFLIFILSNCLPRNFLKLKILV